ncbi:uncharacterized protein [Lepeophtheirus salmonis]|nr:uncharacterized protein LOC121128807 [Lepeophtheirus salmonis]
MPKPFHNIQIPLYDSKIYNNLIISLERYMCLKNFTYHCLNDSDKEMIASIHRGSFSTALQYGLVILCFYIVSLLIVLILHLNELHGKWNWSFGDIQDLLFGNSSVMRGITRSVPSLFEFSSSRTQKDPTASCKEVGKEDAEIGVTTL